MHYGSLWSFGNIATEIILRNIAIADLPPGARAHELARNDHPSITILRAVIRADTERGIARRAAVAAKVAAAVAASAAPSVACPFEAGSYGARYFDSLEGMSQEHLRRRRAELKRQLTYTMHDECRRLVALQCVEARLS
jgi:hypothetical protein